MSRRMSCSMTVDAVRNRTKTVTRRHVDTWTTIQPGHRLTLVEKAMGLPKGATQVVLAEVEIVDVRLELLWHGMSSTEMALEGFDQWDCTDRKVTDWCIWWAENHGYRIGAMPQWRRMVQCRRIEWRYLP